MPEVSAGAPLLWDARWAGTHGIARFASEVRARLGHRDVVDLDAGGNPASPLDAARLVRLQRSHPERWFVSPGFSGAPFARRPQLLTVHDLIHLHGRGRGAQLRRAYYQSVVRPVIREAGVVVTVSEYSRGTICEWAGLRPEQVVVAPNGLSAAITGALPALPAEGPFVLLVSNDKPHKNNALAVGAMRHLPEEVSLHTVGVSAHVVRELAARLGVRAQRVVPHGRLTDDELGALYRAAACLALPSRMEGFGLPALEAMGSGTPTAYVADAVGEVVGDLGVRAGSAHRPEEYARAVDEGMASKERLSSALRARADGFTWDATARKFDEAIDLLLSGAAR